MFTVSVLSILYFCFDILVQICSWNIIHNTCKKYQTKLVSSGCRSESCVSMYCLSLQILASMVDHCYKMHTSSSRFVHRQSVLLAGPDSVVCKICNK